MDAYSLELRKKIVEAKERDVPTVEVARTFGVGLSCVKRYAATARGEIPRPEEEPRLQAQAGRRRQEAPGGRPRGAPGGTTLPQRREFLRRTLGVLVSDSTLWWALKRLGWTRKKDRWARANATSS